MAAAASFWRRIGQPSVSVRVSYGQCQRQVVLFSIPCEFIDSVVMCTFYFLALLFSASKASKLEHPFVVLVGWEERSAF